jgi:hypothetical protein
MYSVAIFFASGFDAFIKFIIFSCVYFCMFVFLISDLSIVVAYLMICQRISCQRHIKVSESDVQTQKQLNHMRINELGRRSNFLYINFI